ncbi:MAG: hypothetical protein HYX69_03595 [Planctomycetia bacterium]|nr:hypothetical protein [Planctomycetia bacterium]
MQGERYSESDNYFNYAVCRTPGANFADGITSKDGGEPIDYGKALEQHARYVDTLRDLGISVTVLQPDARFPDGCFVEDTAVVLEKGAMITNPGDVRRRGEAEVIYAEIDSIKPTARMTLPGTLDGGDVLRIRDHFYIGVSNRSKANGKLPPRTNEKGVRQLVDFLRSHGFEASFVEVDSVLHLKTGITYVGKNTVVGLDEFVNHAAFSQYKKIVVPPEEPNAANVLFVNDALIMHAGNPKTEAKLRAYGFDVRAIPMSEFEKMDGGVTCLSIPMQTQERLESKPAQRADRTL